MDSSFLIMDNQLYNHPSFSTRSEFLPVDERVLLAYDRAKAVLRAWSTSKFPAHGIAVLTVPPPPIL